MESVLDDCLAKFSSKYVLKEEQRQAVLGLLGDVVAVLPTGLGRSLIQQLFGIVVASPLQSIINDQIEALTCRGTM